MKWFGKGMEVDRRGFGSTSVDDIKVYNHFHQAEYIPTTLEELNITNINSNDGVFDTKDARLVGITIKSGTHINPKVDTNNVKFKTDYSTHIDLIDYKSYGADTEFTHSHTGSITFSNGIITDTTITSQYLSKLLFNNSTKLTRCVIDFSKSVAETFPLESVVIEESELRNVTIKFKVRNYTQRDTDLLLDYVSKLISKNIIGKNVSISLLNGTNVIEIPLDTNKFSEYQFIRQIRMAITDPMIFSYKKYKIFGKSNVDDTNQYHSHALRMYSDVGVVVINRLEKISRIYDQPILELLIGSKLADEILNDDRDAIIKTLFNIDLSTPKEDSNENIIK